MKKYIGYLFLFVPVATLQAQVKPAASRPVTSAEKGEKEAFKPESVAKVIAEFKDKKITVPYAFVNKWNQLQADMLRQKAKEFREMAPNTEHPKLYQMLARRTRMLSKFMRRPKLKLTKDIQMTAHPRDWLELVVRKQELLSQKYAFMAKQTSDEEVKSILESLSKRFQHKSDLLKEALAMKEEPTTHPLEIGPARIRTVEGTQLPQKTK